MRLTSVVLSVIVTLVAGSPTVAQERADEVEAGVAVGVVFPAGELNVAQDAGVGLAGHVSYFVLPHLGVRADLGLDFLNASRDAFGVLPSPPMTLVHVSGGIEVDFPRPAYQAHPMTFRLNLGLGFTSASADGSFEDGSSVDFGETMFSLHGGAQVGYEVSSRAEVYATTLARYIRFDEDATRVFSARSAQMAPFDSSWTVPVLLGVRVNVQ